MCSIKVIFQLLVPTDYYSLAFKTAYHQLVWIAQALRNIWALKSSSLLSFAFASQSHSLKLFPFTLFHAIIHKWFTLNGKLVAIKILWVYNGIKLPTQTEINCLYTSLLRQELVSSSPSLSLSTFTSVPTEPGSFVLLNSLAQQLNKNSLLVMMWCIMDQGVLKSVWAMFCNWLSQRPSLKLIKICIVVWGGKVTAKAKSYDQLCRCVRRNFRIWYGLFRFNSST